MKFYPFYNIHKDPSEGGLVPCTRTRPQTARAALPRGGQNDAVRSNLKKRAQQARGKAQGIENDDLSRLL